MPSEMRPLVRAAGLRPAMLGGLPVRCGSAGATPIVAITTGIGMEAAAAAVGRLLDAASLDLVLVVGLAGGIGRGSRIADVIVPEQVVDARTGRTYRPAPLAGVPAQGLLRSGDDIVGDAAEAARLEAQGVVAVDMETAAVAAVCEMRGCAWSVVRAISDRAGETPREIFGLVHADGAPNLAAVAVYLLRRPSRLAGLLRLGRDSSRAARAAAEAALRACAARQDDAQAAVPR